MRCNPLQRLTLRLSQHRRFPRADRLLSFSDFQAGRALACLFPQKPETGSRLTGPKAIYRKQRQMKKFKLTLLAAVSLLLSASGFVQAAAPAKEAATHASMTEDKAIAHVMKKQFEKPDAPLQVAPVSVEGDYAVAGWIQHGRGGRALLKKEKAQWTIQLCGGDGLLQASALSMTGMSQAAAGRLAAKVAAAEKKLTADQRRQLSLFDGIVKVEGGAHAAHPPAHGAGAHSR